MQRQALKLVCIWLFLSLTFCAYSHVVYNKQPNFSSSLYIIVISVHGFLFCFCKGSRYTYTQWKFSLSRNDGLKQCLRSLQCEPNHFVSNSQYQSTYIYKHINEKCFVKKRNIKQLIELALRFHAVIYTFNNCRKAQLIISEND